MASSDPTAQEYTAAMERHGTPEWTEDDARVAERWLAHRRGVETKDDHVREVARPDKVK